MVGRGWAGVKNGDLLQRMRGHYDVLVTMARSLGFQQNISALPFAVILVRAPSNRMLHLRPLVLAILDVIAVAQPGRLYAVGA